MNQEKIMKAKMITAIIIAAASLIAAFIFAGLYSDQKKQNRLDHIDQYEKNLAQAADEIDNYLEKQTDYDLHYNMVLSDLGAARSMIFLISDYTEEQKTINEIHYCFVKYPEQMPEQFVKIYETDGVDRAVCDYIAGMSDTYSLKIFNQLYVPKFWIE